jgi:polynucleotide 5'-kinase involved in rRNA processing
MSNKRSSNTICGEGYVYMGPLTTEQYEISSECVNGTGKKPLKATFSSSSTDSQTLSSASLTEVPKTNQNRYRFKVMLLGDSGVGKSLFVL